MKKYGNFINENNSELNEIPWLSDERIDQGEVPENYLVSVFKELGKWLYRKDGLGLMVIIDNILEPYCTKLDSSEVKRLEEGMELLKLTGYDNIQGTLRHKAPKGLSNLSLVRDFKGDWDPVNKLNTNYAELSLLLKDIIKGLVNDDNDNVRKYGKMVLKSIILDDVKRGLLKMKPKLEKIIYYLFIKKGEGLEEFRKYTDHIKAFSKKGEAYERRVSTYLSNNGFKILYEGGDGDFIDMIFGCDLIVHREDFGYKSIQIKSFQPKNMNEFKYYKVDWLISPVKFTTSIMDVKTMNQIKI